MNWRKIWAWRSFLAASNLPFRERWRAAKLAVVATENNNKAMKSKAIYLRWLARYLRDYDLDVVIHGRSTDERIVKLGEFLERDMTYHAPLSDLLDQLAQDLEDAWWTHQVWPRHPNEHATL